MVVPMPVTENGHVTSGCVMRIITSFDHVRRGGRSGSIYQFHICVVFED